MDAVTVSATVLGKIEIDSFLWKSSGIADAFTCIPAEIIEGNINVDAVRSLDQMVFRWSCSSQNGPATRVFTDKPKGAVSALDKEDKTYQADVVIVWAESWIKPAAAALQAGKESIARWSRYFHTWGHCRRWSNECTRSSMARNLQLSRWSVHVRAKNYCEIDPEYLETYVSFESWCWSSICSGTRGWLCLILPALSYPKRNLYLVGNERFTREWNSWSRFICFNWTCPEFKFVGWKTSSANLFVASTMPAGALKVAAISRFNWMGMPLARP